MGLKSDLNDAVSEIFDDFSDISTPVVYKELISEVAVAGGVINRTYTDHSLSVIISKFTVQDRQNETIKNDDLKILVAAKNLGFVPDTKGVFVIGSSEAVVIHVSKDPSESLYVVQARQ